jgi:acyl-CoA synthetase (AMP-forming)/AMP-acid ligase II
LPEEEMLMPSEFIKREKIEFWNSVPSLVSFMNKMGQLTPNCFPDLKYSMFCGEQFPKQIADAWRKAAPNSTIENLYGPTEATIYISRYVYKNEDSSMEFKNSIVPIGQPLPGQLVAIVDEEGNKVGKGETGEICFKGKQVTNGYLHDELKTNQVFVNFEWDNNKSGKWYRTGDLGFVNNAGDVECIGRRDSQIKLGGRRIEIGEIESVLSRFVHTSDAVVVAVRDENDIVTGCVAFTSNLISKEEESNIRKESMSLIERVFFPKNIYYIESFPLNPSGKIDRKTLAQMAKERMSSKR